MYLGAIAMDINTNFCDLPPFFFCEKNIEKKFIYPAKEARTRSRSTGI